MRGEFIRFEADGNWICAKVYTATTAKRDVWHLSFRLEHEASAILMAKHLRDVMADLVRAAREKAYNEGYADGRLHRGKATHFPCRLRVNNLRLAQKGT